MVFHLCAKQQERQWKPNLRLVRFFIYFTKPSISLRFHSHQLRGLKFYNCQTQQPYIFFECYRLCSFDFNPKDPFYQFLFLSQILAVLHFRPIATLFLENPQNLLLLIQISTPLKKIPSNLFDLRFYQIGDNQLSRFLHRFTSKSCIFLQISAEVLR